MDVLFGRRLMGRPVLLELYHGCSFCRRLMGRLMLLESYNGYSFWKKANGQTGVTGIISWTFSW